MINLVLAVGVAGALPSAERAVWRGTIKSQATHTSRARLHHTRNDPCSTPLYLAVTRALVAPSQRRLLLLEPILRAEGPFILPPTTCSSGVIGSGAPGTTDSDDRRFPHGEIA